jgi:hypothetical protein
MLSCT